jgi:dihydroflavonol-4-reductase
MTSGERVLLTGGTGIVGSSIARALITRGRRVRALVRSPERGRASLPEGCELALGDVTDAASVSRALEGCDVVYHAAGLPEQWLPDSATFDHVNVGGTRNLVNAALAHGVRRFVYTSTIDVFVMPHDREFDERVLDPEAKATAYERSKQEADRLVAAAVERGLPAVFLHPSGLYGPAAAASPGLNRAIAQIVRRELPLLLPGAVPLVYCNDVATGHLLAEERAPVGGRYILSDGTLSLHELAEAVCEVAGRGRVPPMMPTWLARLVAGGGEVLARVTGRPPLISRGQVHFIGLHARPSSRRIQQELGWKPTPLRDALRATLDWMAARGEI